jgi:hypothetical protein
MAQWHKFTRKTMPPVNGKTFLICRGYKNDDDKLMFVAKWDDSSLGQYIRYCGHLGGGVFGWRILHINEYRDTLWQEIEYP